MEFLALAYVAIGGALGSMCRYGLGLVIKSVHASDFPLSTFAVNILGGLLMGAWIALAANMAPERARELHLLFAVGVLGGFTTFSAFSLELFLLLERGLIWQAGAYALGSVVLSVLALLSGMWCIRLIAG